MPIKESIQIPSKDGCIYVYDLSEKRWYKFCPTDVLPSDVKSMVSDLKEHADLLKDAKQA